MRSPSLRKRRLVLSAIILALGIVVMILIAAGSGQYPLSPAQVTAGFWRGLTGTKSTDPALQMADATLWTIRFPRLVMALIVGAALASAGALMQGVFANPLAEPGIVGVSAGAAAAASVVIVTGLSVFGQWTLVAGAFLGGLVSTLLVYASARNNGRTEVVTLILTGIALNAIAGALIAFMSFLGDSSSREQIVFWQLGSLNGSRWVHVYTVLPVVIICLILAQTFGHRLNLLSLGEKSAQHLGMNVERSRFQIILLVAMLTSAAVAFAGIIAFVGLVVPHIVRLLLGPNHKVLIPMSAALGAFLLLLADTLARTIVPYADLPIGLLTSLVGGPFFFYLIRITRARAGGWS